MRLIIIRHGQTKGNQEKIIEGTIPGELTETGHLQASRVAERLKNEKIDFIYTSDLNRAVQTAEAIAKNHPHATLIKTKELRERSWGSVQGLQKDEINWTETRKPYYTPHARPGHGETLNEVFLRAEKFLKRIAKEHPDGTIVLIGHGTINRALISILSGSPVEDYAESKKPKNSAICQYDIKNEKVVEEIFNCTKHLD